MNLTMYLRTCLAYLYNDLLLNPFVSPYRGFRRKKKLLSRHSNLFEELKKYGYTIIPNYINPIQCNQTIIDLKKTFEQYNNYTRNSDDKRLFGVEQIIPVARMLAQDQGFLEIGELVNREYTYCAFTLGGWLQSGNAGSSGGGWHRDAFFSQYKAMVYLNDVTEDNGPFEILPGSHKLPSVLKGIRKAGLGHMQDRLSDFEVSSLEEVLGTFRKTLIGNAGTLILFNSSTVHRGRPINRGERLALTNYYFPVSRDPRSVLDQFSPVITAADVYKLL